MHNVYRDNRFHYIPTERTKKLVMFCFNDRCRVADQNDFHLLLETVENLVSDESDEAATDAVTGLREAAVGAGGAAAAAAAAHAGGAAVGICTAGRSTVAQQDDTDDILCEGERVDKRFDSYFY
jgi:hypothetical protein